MAASFPLYVLRRAAPWAAVFGAWLLGAVVAWDHAADLHLPQWTAAFVAAVAITWPAIAMAGYLTITLLADIIYDLRTDFEHSLRGE